MTIHTLILTYVMQLIYIYQSFTSLLTVSSAAFSIPLSVVNIMVATDGTEHYIGDCGDYCNTLYQTNRLSSRITCNVKQTSVV